MYTDKSTSRVYKLGFGKKSGRLVQIRFPTLLHHYTFQFQILADNKLGTAGAKCFCKMLSVNAGLRKLDLSGEL